MNSKPGAPMTNASDDPAINGMTLATTQKLWLTLALATNLFALVAHGQTQGSDIDPKLSVVVGFSFVPGLLDSIVAMWGILILSILLILNAAVMREHASRSGPTWLERYPFRLWDASPSLGLGRKAQLLAYFFFSILPLFALGHFWRVFLGEGKLCSEVTQDNWSPLAVGAHDFFHFPADATFGRIFGDYYRLAGEVVGPDACKDATTIFPVVQPVAMVLLTVFAVFVTFRALSVVWRGK
ncbi:MULTISPECIES: hypothetical protein [unclassified Mesorhizobium]|uniref:hypothetical protein n=1 Tax=unclassified Mesorhizobium TaxID=325217 RepID=UPI000FCB0D3F|nr:MULTISPECIES: hypothetical protein [unclassified Mesorhizobium]RUX33323.1 hypothetical protein EOA23_07280 [Mesorhizobium sp. M2A.F.Ca.ET.042.01.1.1]RWD69837.1 MAG: hypothetical protein EOS37_16785 [Mesorhizobium sp.]